MKRNTMKLGLEIEFEPRSWRNSRNYRHISDSTSTILGYDGSYECLEFRGTPGSPRNVFEEAKYYMNLAKEDIKSAGGIGIILGHRHPCGVHIHSDLPYDEGGREWVDFMAQLVRGTSIFWFPQARLNSGYGSPDSHREQNWGTEWRWPPATLWAYPVVFKKLLKVAHKAQIAIRRDKDLASDPKIQEISRNLRTDLQRVPAKKLVHFRFVEEWNEEVMCGFLSSVPYMWKLTADSLTSVEVRVDLVGLRESRGEVTAFSPFLLNKIQEKGAKPPLPLEKVEGVESRNIAIGIPKSYRFDPQKLPKLVRLVKFGLSQLR